MVVARSPARDAGGDAEAGVGIDGNGEGGAEGGGIVHGLGVEGEAVAVGGGEGDAEDAAGFADHEVDDFGGDELGGADEVAFVLAVFVVGEDDHFALAEGGEDVGDGGEGHGDSGNAIEGHFIERTP